MKTLVFYTLGTVAKVLGVTKPTVSSWVDKGELPVVRNSKGHYQIQRVDLERLYSEKVREVDTGHQVASKSLHPLPQNNNGVLLVANSPNQETIKKLSSLIDEKERARLEAEKSAEHWRTEYRGIQAQLTGQGTEVNKATLVDIELTPKSVIRRRPLTLRERIFGGTVAEVEEVA